ncbi:MAG: 1,4-dihydroxy-2-naphthoate octaprenyltransferase [Flavobacteriales bacterium]|nr:MAG: 1,4-dihydroxy-2-naphthoate octaprenyltransferase [Flavobacteriales bacterium]
MKTKAFIHAARLRTLPLSVSGIIVGSATAYGNGYFNWLIFILAIAVTLGFQILSNFANDYGDGVRGTDNHTRVGPQRAIQSGVITQKEMIKAIKITASLTFLIALILLYIAFGREQPYFFLLFVVLGIASIAAAIKYTMGKKAYGYSGFGDLFVLLFFGWLSVLGSYFLFVQTLPLSLFLSATAIGFLSVGVLNLNNLRDWKSDKQAGKNTLVVKIGEEFAKYYHYYLLVTAFLLLLAYTVLTYKKPIEFLFILAFIPVYRHAMVVYHNKDTRLLDPELKKLALSTVLVALLFALGKVL